MDLELRALSVNTREELAAFVQHMRRDFDDHPERWENIDLETFLEAMAAWIQDMLGYYKNSGQVLSELPMWQVFADILMGARIYE